MFRSDHKEPPPGRVASRWFLFVVFYHLLPVPWFLAVAAGLAPASFLLAAGMAGLFNTDFDSLAFSAMLLVPALIAGLIFTLLAMLLAAAIGKLRSPRVRTLALLVLAASCVGISLLPVYITGGHSGEKNFSLPDFFTILGQFQVSRTIAVGYFICLTVLLVLLLVAQHRPGVFPRLPNHFGRRITSVVLILLACAFLWTHHVLLVIAPLAKLGFASQQYRLAKVLREHPGSESSSNLGAREWLTRAAQQGHLQAAMELADQPLSAADKLHWLTIAGEGGLPEAEYKLYQLLSRKGELQDFIAAGEWLMRAASNGHRAAQYDLGKLYTDGSEVFGVAKDPHKGQELWKQAAAQGHGLASQELAWRYNLGSVGFKRDPQKAIELYEQLADGFTDGSLDLPVNAQMAAGARQQARQITALEQQLELGDVEALFKLGSQLIDVSRNNPETVAEGFVMLEQAAESGRVDIQYFLGAVFMFGNYGQPRDFPRGQRWWDMASEQNHVKTMEYLANAYQNGQFGYSVDLLKSKAITAKLVEAYRDGLNGVDPNPQKADYWSRELKHFDRLFEIAGGNYQPLDPLRAKADSGDAASQYQLGRQLLVSGAPDDRQQGYKLIERAADAGYAEAQYRLVTYYENHLHIMRNNPERGIAMLKAAAGQNHLPAMGTLALAYYKGSFGLPKDYRQAQEWYERLLAIYDGGAYLGEIDERFIEFQQRQLGYTKRELVTQLAREERLANASPVELQIIAIEDRYRKDFERAVNALDQRDKVRFRAEIDRLRLHYQALREQEITMLKKASE